MYFETFGLPYAILYVSSYQDGSLVRTQYILCAIKGMDGFCLAVAVNSACNTSKQDRRAYDLWGKTVSSTRSGFPVEEIAGKE